MTAVATPASVLLVDDTVENLRVLGGMLERRGFEVRPVTSGEDALVAVDADPPDVILLDVSMPEMDGFDLCMRLKEKPDFRDIPVIFLTAHTELNDKLKGFASGGMDYITKPFQFEEVVTRVSHQLALRTARKQLAESLARLQELEKLRDDLVHMVVHDMRSPLSALIMGLELVSEQLGSPHRELLDLALEGAQRVNAMASTLLDISRLEAGMMPVHAEPCDLAQLVAEAKDAVHGLDPGRAIDNKVTLPLLVRCDRNLIRRVLENLIGNGIKHTPRGGSLRISAQRLPRAVRVNVADEGRGVPAHLQARIFEKFGAASASRQGAYHSAGLGLAFCKLAVEAHGGSIGVDCSEPPGSRFWFELPA